MAIRRPSPSSYVGALTYSLAEAAPFFPCTERWLNDQIRSGRFSARKIGGHWRMTMEDIDHALEQCRRANQPSADHGNLGLTSGSRRRMNQEKTDLETQPHPR